MGHPLPMSTPSSQIHQLQSFCHYFCGSLTRLSLVESILRVISSHSSFPSLVPQLLQVHTHCTHCTPPMHFGPLKHLLYCTQWVTIWSGLTSFAKAAGELSLTAPTLSDLCPSTVYCGARLMDVTTPLPFAQFAMRDFRSMGTNFDMSKNMSASI